MLRDSVRRYVAQILLPIEIIVALYFLFRLIFYVTYAPPEVSLNEAVQAFIWGVRYDLSVAFILTSTLLVPQWLIGGRIRVLLNGVIAVLFSWAIANAVSDFFYYPVVGRHVAQETKIFFENFGDIMRMGLESYPHIVTLMILGLLLPFPLFRKLGLLKPLDNPFPLRIRLLLFLLWFPVSIFFIRGGAQHRPLNTAMAFQDDNHFLGTLTLNPGYTTLTALYRGDTLPVWRNDYMKHMSVVRDRLAADNESFPEKKFVFYRRKQIHRAHSESPGNVVIFILESWNASDVISYAPFFHRLSKEGLYFKRAYASGQRSISSLPSIISSIPALFGRVYTTAAYNSNRQRGIGSIFKEKGYATIFAYAANKGSMNFDNYARIAGFTQTLSRRDFSDRDEDYDGAWGIFDGVTFMKMNQIFRDQKQPFLSVIYTLHPHPPYKLPRNYRAKIPSEVPRSDYLNALRYCDDSLRAFFEAAEKESYFKNTLFVFTADHAFGENLNGLEQFHIPLLFWGAGVESPKEYTKIASQVSILPTILDILKVGTTHASMGPSLLSGKETFAVMDSGSSVLYYSRDLLLEYSEQNLRQAFELREGRRVPVSNQKLLKRELFFWENYESAVASAINENRIAP